MVPLRGISRRQVPAVLVAAVLAALAILGGASADISRDGRLVLGGDTVLSRGPRHG